MLSNFHFLHPLWLLGLPLIIFIVWRLIQIQDSARVWRKLIDEKFLPYLLEKQNKKLIKAPIFIGIVMSLMLVTLSSPAWKLKQNSHSNDKAEVVFILNVSKSMLKNDLRPSRLERAIFKINDFLTQRSDISSALVAYLGSAHLVMPLSRDKKIINSFALALTPSIMPQKGDALYSALKLSTKQFKGVEGTMIVLTDQLSKREVEKIENDTTLNTYKIIVYNVSSQALMSRNISKLSSSMGTEFVSLTFDDTDIQELSSEVDYQFLSALSKEKGAYEDGGYYFLIIIIFLMLFWFREGFIAEAWRRK